MTFVNKQLSTFLPEQLVAWLWWYWRRCFSLVLSFFGLSLSREIPPVNLWINISKLCAEDSENYANPRHPSLRTFRSRFNELRCRWT
jgi:hypothetical protein